MFKIAVGNDVEKGAIDLDYNLIKNLNNLADCKKKKLTDLTVCYLDRPRHNEIINTLDKLKIKKKPISDGDVAGALLVTDKKFNVDMFIGIGGGPEGVISASALDAYNCFFQGRFLFNEEIDIKRAKEMGIVDLQKKYEINEIVSGDSIFVATGITDGDLVSGIKINDNKFTSESFVTHKASNTKEIRINNLEIL